jgi:hypothetical protein
MVARNHRFPRHRSEERGTAIFVVVLVVTMLTGVGLFAARITNSVDIAAGYAQQAAQARALALYSSQMALAALSGDNASIVVQMDAVANGAAPDQCPTNGYLPGLECAIRNHQDVIRIAAATGAAAGVLTAQQASTPGSLGPPTGLSTILGTDGNLNIEFFERVAAPPPAGNNQGGNGGAVHVPFEYAITASAQIRPVITAASPAWCSPDNASSSANVQAVRLYVTVP